MEWEDKSKTGIQFINKQLKNIQKIRIILQTNLPENEFTEEEE